MATFPLNAQQVDGNVQLAQTFFLSPQPWIVPRVMPSVPRVTPTVPRPAPVNPRPMPGPYDPMGPVPMPDTPQPEAAPQEGEQPSDQAPGPGSDECTGDCPEPRCRTLVMCFKPGADIDRGEFERQMELQEDGMNRMSPSQMLANQDAYRADPAGMRAQADGVAEQARAEFRTNPNVQAMYQAQHGLAFGNLALIEDTTGAGSRLVALHNPDMVAGGAFNSVVDQSLPITDRIGTRSANSSLGGQWRGGRADRVRRHAQQQQQNGCPSVQIDMRICDSKRGAPGEPANPNSNPPDGPPPANNSIIGPMVA